MNRVAVACGVFAAVMLAPLSRALARPREVIVVPSTNRCVDADALARAIHRDTSLPVRVAKGESVEGRSGDGEQEAPGNVVVEVKGRDEVLTVELRGPELQVSQPLRASACETASDVAAAFVASLLAPPPPIVVPPASEASPPATALAEKDDRVAERAALMLDDLDTEIRQRWSPTLLRIIVASAAATSSVLSFYEAANTHETGFYLRGTGYGVWALGTVSTFLAPDDYTRTILDVSACAGVGLVWLGINRDSTENGISPYAIGGISGALFVESALIGAGALVRRPVSRATLVAHYESIRTPERRSALTADQLARIEADFRRTSPPLPRWVLAAPLFAGGGLAIGAAIDDTRSSDVARVVEGIAGALLLGVGTLTLYPLSGYGHYERLLERNGLQASVQAAPGQRISLQVQGTF